MVEAIRAITALGFGRILDTEATEPQVILDGEKRPRENLPAFPVSNCAILEVTRTPRSLLTNLTFFDSVHEAKYVLPRKPLHNRALFMLDFQMEDTAEFGNTTGIPEVVFARIDVCEEMPWVPPDALKYPSEDLLRLYAAASPSFKQFQGILAIIRFSTEHERVTELTLCSSHGVIYAWKPTAGVTASFLHA